jgi:hypothetical protein
LNTYKPHGSIFKYIKRHVPLKKVVSWLKRGQIVPFLREKRPFKKSTQKYNAASGIIAGELLTDPNSAAWKLPPKVLKLGRRDVIMSRIQIGLGGADPNTGDHWVWCTDSLVY